MKEPLFRSAKTTQAVITAVMFGLLGLSLAAAYTITLRPSRPRAVIVPNGPVTTAPDYDDDEE